MTLSALQKAEIDRDALLLTIAYVEIKIINHDKKPICVSGAETLIEKCKKILDELFQIQTRIAAQQPDATLLAAHGKTYIDLVERLDECIIKLKTIIKNKTPPDTATPSTSNPSRSVKLPEMKLPKFFGNYEDWTSFADLFKHNIDQDSRLSSAQKLLYLQGCVEGDAKTLIKSFTITDANYAEAWTVLSTRYNNIREIIYALVKKFLQLPSITQDSTEAVQSLLNSTQECVRSLKVMGRPTDTWDDLLVVIVVEKLDSDSRAEWAKTLTSTNPTTFLELTEFLETRIRSLLARGTFASTSTLSASKAPPQQKQQARTYHTSSPSCSLCKEGHNLFQCKKLHDMEPSARMIAVKKTAACINCLREGHAMKDCSSKNSCRHCKKRHHTFLHHEIIATSGGHQKTVSTHTTTAADTAVTQTLLKTALVSLVDLFGNKQTCRAFLDDGSEVSYMTERTYSGLRLKRTRTDVIVKGIAGCAAARAKWKVTTRIFSSYDDTFVDVECYILPQVTGQMPRSKLDISTWKHLQKIQLADPKFNNPGEIDILLGGDVVSSVMKNGIRHGKKNSPTAQKTIFGWVVSGKVSSTSATIVHAHHSTCQLTELVQRFWEIERGSSVKPHTPEEEACENFFKSSTTRDPTGRYMVRLPFHDKYKNNIFNCIGETRNFAMRRLYQLERRFQKYPNHHQSYIDFMNEYLTLGHMEPADPSNQAIYIPHHFVLKEDSTTTKLRVVFDASMKSTTGISLNDMLMVGPTIQEDFFVLLIRFRLNMVALKADVAKMYRQFQLHPDDRNFGFYGGKARMNQSRSIDCQLLPMERQAHPILPQDVSSNYLTMSKCGTQQQRRPFDLTPLWMTYSAPTQVLNLQRALQRSSSHF